MPPMLTPASPRMLADRADDARPVGVLEDEHVVGQRHLEVVAVDADELLDHLRAGERARDR